MTTKAFQEELNKFKLPENIRHEAVKIHGIIAPDTGTRRCTMRKEMIFFCVYGAYLETGDVRAPQEIATLVGISHTQSAQALKMFSKPRTAYSMPSVITHPKDLVANYARTCGIREDIIPQIEAMCARLTANTQLARMHPQPVAAGLLRYYMQLNGLTMDTAQLPKLFNVTQLALDKAYKIITQIDNT